LPRAFRHMRYRLQVPMTPDLRETAPLATEKEISFA
jgi:hypothetical protein